MKLLILQALFLNDTGREALDDQIKAWEEEYHTTMEISIVIDQLESWYQSTNKYKGRFVTMVYLKSGERYPLLTSKKELDTIVSNATNIIFN